MSWKTINPTMEYHRYMVLQYRYLRFICSIKKIDMLKAIEQFGFRYKRLYAKRMRFNEGRLS